MDRRSLLVVTGSAGATLLTGCLVHAPGSEPTAETVTETPGVTTATIEILNQTSSVSDESATISFGSPVSVDGTITGNDGCYTASLETVEYEPPTLTIRVVAEPEPTTETVACTESIVSINYLVTVAVSGPAPDEIVVEHDSMEGDRVVASATRTG